MLFDKKVKRDMEVMQERNRRYLEAMEQTEPSDNEQFCEDTQKAEDIREAMTKAKAYRQQNEDLGLEKGDVFALILSALLVFGPILLILVLLLTLAWILLH